MSVITPLLDTLLHEVLGKPRNFPLPRDLNQPVDATHVSVPARSPHSDSRLDARQPNTTELSNLAAAARRMAPGAAPSATLQSAAPQPPGGVATTFSPAAQRIAEMLAKLPSATPLTTPGGQPLLGNVLFAEPARVAQVLQQAIDKSGLFFEARLLRWFRGEVPRQQLEEQPQMQLLKAEGRDEEAVQTLVRQQLDLLSAPQLRWEGQPWPGLWLQLMIQVPVQPLTEWPASTEPEQREETNGQREVSSTLVVELQPLGRIEAALRLKGMQLDIVVCADSVQTLTYLKSARNTLETRLSEAGFSPSIQLTFKEKQSDE